MNKFLKVILGICITLIVLLGIAVFFLFNAVKYVTNNNNLIQNPTTSVVSEQAVTTTQNSSQDTTQSGMETTTSVATTQAPTQTPSITQEQAISAALTHAGLTAGTDTFTHAQLDQFDDNIPQIHYDVEIISGGYEYDYKIDATNGNVISNIKEIHD